MTITSTATTFETTGNGVDTSFIFNYPIHKSTDLKVYAAGVLRLSSDGTYGHTITIAANKQSATVVFTTAPANTIALKFEREVEYKQETDLANNSLFDAESLETTLDNIVMQLQQVGNIVTSTADSRTFSFDGGIPTSDYLPSTPSDASTLNSTKAARRGKALMFDATTGDITISGDNLDTTIDYQLEAKDWASKAAGNVNTYTGGVENSDGTNTSAKVQALAAAADALSVATIYDNFDDRYLGAHTTSEREDSPNTGKDHDGVALVDGAMYFDTTLNAMRVWDDTSSVWVQIAPGTVSQTNIDILTTKYDGSTTASSGTNLNIAQVDSVADNISDISDVADIESDVSDVAAIDSQVTSVATNIADIGDVADMEAEILRLGTPLMSTATTGHLALLGTSAMAHASTGHIKKVADIDTHVSTVSGISAAVSGVNTISADVTAVNADAVDIGKVAAVDTEVGLLAALDTEIGLIGTSAYAHPSTGYIKLVADDASDIGLCASRATEIGLLGTVAMASGASAYLAVLGTSAMTNPSTGYLKLVADIDDKITTVAGIQANVTSVANDATDIGTVATDLAGSDTIGTVAAAIADVNRYANEYKIQASEPGSPSEGDIWMDTTNNVFKVHNGTSFTTVTEGQTAGEVTAEATAQAISMSIALG